MIRKLNQIKCCRVGGAKANREGVIEEPFRKLGASASTGPDYSHPRALEGLENVIARPPAFVSESEDCSGEVPDTQSRMREYLFFKTGKRTTVVIIESPAYLGYLGRQKNKSSNNQFATTQKNTRYWVVINVSF